MHEQALRLEALWREDHERDELLRERKGLDDRLKQARSGHAEAERRLNEATQHLGALTSEEQEHTQKLNNYLKRRDQAQGLIDTGRAPDYTVAQMQVTQCNAAVGQEEDILLALFDRIDAARAEQEAAKNGVGLMSLRVREAEAARDAKAPGLDERIAAATALVKAAREGIQREHLARYDILRGKGQTPFAEVRDGACVGCNVKINAISLAEHRRSVAVTACASCGRFLGALA